MNENCHVPALWSSHPDSPRPGRTMLWRGTFMFTCLETVTCAFAARHAVSQSSPLRAGGILSSLPVMSPQNSWEDTGWACNKSFAKQGNCPETGVQCQPSLEGWIGDR